MSSRDKQVSGDSGSPTPALTLSPLVEMLARRFPLGARERAAILALPHEVSLFTGGKFLAHQGGSARHCFAVLSGFLISDRIANDERRQIVSLFLDGDLIGFRPGTGRAGLCTVQALGAVTIAAIPSAALQQAIADFAPVGLALLAYADARMAMLVERLVSLGRRDASARIAHLMCEQAALQTSAGLGRGIDYAWPLTQAQLADATGLTSVHVNRILQKLRADGLIRLGSRTLSILDRQGLRATGGFDPAYLNLPDPAA